LPAVLFVDRKFRIVEAMKLSTRFLRILTWIILPCTVALGAIALHAATETPKLNLQTKPISPETKKATSFAPIAKNAARSVVNIYTSRTFRQSLDPFFDDPMFRFFFGEPRYGFRAPREYRSENLGSGVIVSSDGYILSNNHVIEDADEIKVALSDGKEYTAKVIGSDPPTDVAVLKIDAKDLPAIPIADSDHLEVGDQVLAIGNPFGVGQTVTVGYVSGLGRGGFGIVDYEDFIQTDASINPGNSGGALIDAEGRLVGINTAIISRTGGNQGIGFAVPINLARSVMERIIEDGKVTRGYLGVTIQPVTEELAREFKLPDSAGALVGDVSLRSPAEKAGVKAGDVIVEFNGKKVTDGRHLRLIVAQTAPDTNVTLKVLRDGKQETLTVKLEEQRADGMVRRDRSDRRSFGRSEGDLFDGVAVSDLDSHARREFDLPGHVRGAVVTDVDPRSPAARAGLRPGDVIQEIDRQPVANADDAIELSRNRSGGSVLLRVWSNGGSRYIVLSNPR
jgi:serine protease Do